MGRGRSARFEEFLKAGRNPPRQEPLDWNPVMKIRYLATVAAAAALASPAMAGTWTHLSSPASSPISIEGHSVTFAISPADIWWYDGNIPGGQSPANVQSAVETQYALTAGTLAYVGGCDNVAAGCANTSGGDGTGSTNTFSNPSFSYLAVHYGRGELLFHWTAPQTSFSLSGLPRGLSDYRAFAPAVPEPETYAMLLAGLGVMGAIARRRRQG